MMTLKELRATKEWQNAEYLETRKELLEANQLQAQVALDGLLEDFHADRFKDTITDWYTDVPAVELAEAIETECPGIEATVVSDTLIRIRLRYGWDWVSESVLGVDELLGD